MKLRLLLVLLPAFCLLGGCNLMPEEDPGYHVRALGTGEWEHGSVEISSMGHVSSWAVVESDRR